MVILWVLHQRDVAVLTMTMHCYPDRAQNPSENIKGYFLYCPVTQNITLKSTHTNSAFGQI